MTNYYCYMLMNTDDKYKNYTYCGYTVNPTRRLKQHNEEIKGGAKATKGKGQSWKFLMIITGFKTSHNALSCEWRLKHPDNKSRKDKKYSGKNGRIVTLNEVLLLDKWTEKCSISNCECEYDIYIDDTYKDKLINIPKNIKIKNLSEFDFMKNDQKDGH